MPKGSAKRLTTTGIRRLRHPSEGFRDHYDVVSPGLVLRVRQNRKSFYCRYREETTEPLQNRGRRSTKTRKKTARIAHRFRLIGHFPETTLTTARETAQDMKAAALGSGPKTLSAVAEEFLTRHASKNRTGAETRRILEQNVLPGLESAHIWDFGKPEIHRVLDRILDRGSGVMANRTLAAIKKLTRWAHGRGIISVDPCAGIDPPHKERSRDRVLAPDELVALWGAAGETTTGAAFRFLVLTGQRTGEVANLRWSDIQNGVWHLSQTKNDQPHAVPLPEQANELLSGLTLTQGYVFGSPEKPFANWSRLKRQLDQLVAVDHWRLHDIRRTVATNLAKLGIRPDVTEAVLNHSSGSRAGVAGIYNRHDYQPEIGAALQAWADRLERMLSGGNVQELRK